LREFVATKIADDACSRNIRALYARFDKNPECVCYSAALPGTPVDVVDILETAFMNLHEYQSKQLLARYGIPVPDGHAASSAAQARECAQSLAGDTWMVKAQVHAGGRGKAGGVKMAHSLDEVQALAGAMLGTRLVTMQTTADGQPINEVLVECTTSIGHEYYLSMLVDRAARQVAIIASAAGGMNIEEVAEKEPAKIVTAFIDPAAGLQPNQVRRIGFAFGLDGAQMKQLGTILTALYRLFTENDLALLELNPLCTTGDGDLLALDAKITLDDNALYRHQELETLRDESQEDAKEARARRFDLNYITLDGNIACMVNGAGLAMGTMDIVKLHGGEPANFLDVGGGTDAEKVAEAFKLIVSDDKVKVILVNIFGGIVRCDLIAEGIIKAVKEVGVSLPVVVRLEGTKVNEGRALLAESGLSVISADSLSDAAAKAVAAAA
jgi:succinyl-CoA synthetase beta subunit